MVIEKIGTVTKLFGKATAVDRDGNERILHIGDSVYSNETITTDDSGIVEIHLDNGAYLDLGRESELALEGYVSNTESIAAIQAAIEEGRDPTEVTDPAEAGLLQDEGLDALRIAFEAPRAMPENGFETQGIDFAFRTADEDFLLNPAGVVSEPEVVFSFQATPSSISEGAEETATFIISRTGGPLDPGIEASVQVTAPFDDDDSANAATGTDDSSGDYSQRLFTAIENAALVTEGVDFDPQTGILTFTGNADRLQFSVTVIDDGELEGTEDIVALLSDPRLTNGDATIGNAIANVDIIDDDNLLPQANPDSNFAQEGGPAVSGNVITGPGADNPGDLPASVTAISQSGSNFTVGQTFTTILGGSLLIQADGSYIYTPPPQGNVPIAGATEQFTYTITDNNDDSSSTSLTIHVGDNDLQPQANPDTATAHEGGPAVTGNVTTGAGADNPGDAPATVTAISHNGSTFVVGQALKTALGGSLLIQADGSYTYTPPAQGTVPAEGAREQFTYTITDSDGDNSSTTLNIQVADKPFPEISIDDVRVREGDPFANPDATITFTVSRSGDDSQVSTVDYTVNPGTATLGNDYDDSIDPLFGTLTFVIGETSKTLTFDLIEDFVPETTENFTVNLSAASNATITKHEGFGVIVDNDSPEGGSLQIACQNRIW